MPQIETTDFQPSLTEWFESIGKGEMAAQLRAEDNQRTDRFKVLHAVSGFPADLPEEFEATDLIHRSERFEALLRLQGHLPCAIRLIPKRPELPKLRNRGMPLQECYEKWFIQQPVDPADYTVEVYRHCDAHQWSATFIVNEHGVIGEIIRGQHSQLTKGETKTEPIRFTYDFATWHWSQQDTEAEKEVRRMIERVTISDSTEQRRIHEQMETQFHRQLIAGYFEATVWDTGELFFVDYNRLFGANMAPVDLSTFAARTAESSTLRGAPAYPGEARGRARVVDLDVRGAVEFEPGDILVCRNTDVRYLPFMSLSGAIITARGGILSHAAIVARELQKPCIVSCATILDSIRTGDMLSVNATTGEVTFL